MTGVTTSETFIGDVSSNFNGYATLHKTPMLNLGPKGKSHYWIVSSVRVGPFNESMIFPATKEGKIQNFADVFKLQPANHPAAVEWLERQVEEHKAKKAEER